MAASNSTIINLNEKMERLRIIAFRGDTRPIKEIFNFGMQRRGASFESFTKNNKLIEPTFRGHDIDPPSAVCVTSEFDIAPLFPIKDPAKEIWIYVVKVEYAYDTYKKQREENQALQFAKELALRDIPSSDVLCAIRCERYWNIDQDGHCQWENGMPYKLTSDIIWNPKCANVKINPETQKYIQDLFDKRVGKYIECPIPVNQTHFDKLFKGDFSYQMCDLSEQEHKDREIFVSFIQSLQNDEVNPNERENTAIEFLKNCSDLNKLIPCVGVTPLMYACYNNHLSIITFLLENGAKLDVPESQGLIAEDYATTDEVRKLLFAAKPIQETIHQLKLNANQLNYSGSNSKVNEILKTLNEEINAVAYNLDGYYHLKNKILEAQDKLNVYDENDKSSLFHSSEIALLMQLNKLIDQLKSSENLLSISAPAKEPPKMPNLS